ncbi:pentatricopeptide repeat domain-containing protein [Gigaspora margarita]|uniref:Pentatricopeptide repeat domain-containing protein n=2 Tax=Gigaspora margarita TaxID=4874 RepID=A0A8H3XCF7_GIGMA|nr:pentatricopeptide repeat domain-containing protein [Gigaspora margarita]
MKLPPNYSFVLRFILHNKNPIGFSFTRNNCKSFKIHKNIVRTFANGHQGSLSTVPQVQFDPLPTNLAEQQKTYLRRMQSYLESNDLSSVVREFINLKNQNIVPTLGIYHVLLKSCAKTSDLQSAIQIINQMYADSHQSFMPTKETYKYFLNVVETSSDHLLTMNALRSIANGQVPLATLDSKSLADLQPMNVDIDLDLWKLILKSVTTAHKIYTTQKMDYFEDVKGLCETFIESFRGPYDEETWRLIIRALGSYPKENDTFQTMLQRIQDEQLLTSALYSEIIWALSRKSNIQLAKTYLDRMISKFNYTPSREAFYAMLSYYADLGRFKTVSNLINMYAPLIKDPQIQMTSQQNLRDLWEFDFSTVLMQAYVQALSKYILSQKRLKDQTDSLLDDIIISRMQKTIEQLDFSKDDFTNSSFYSSWKELVNSLSKQSSTLDSNFPKFHRDHYDLIIRFNIFANQVSPKEFPLDKSLEMLKNMRGEGMEPTFETYRIVLEGYAQSSEFQAADEKFVSLRVEKALEIFDLIKLAGYDVDNINVFQPLLESCLPYNSSRENIVKKPDLTRQQEEKKESYNENISLLRSSLTPKIFEIEKLMKSYKVKHTQASTITLFQQLASVGDYKNMWKRWTKLSLMGYRRNEELYETILRLASKDQIESEYAVNVVRHQMKRENPEVKPTFGIWKELMECCVKCDDGLTIKYLINEINQFIQEGNKLREKTEANINIAIRPNEEDINFKLQMLILETCFKLPELHKEGENLMSQLLETKRKLINFEFWKVILNYLVKNSLTDNSDNFNIHQTWEMFVDWRNEHFGFDKDLSRAFSVSNSPIPFMTTTKSSTKHSPSSNSLNQASSSLEKNITIKLPHPPYRIKDIEIGYIYIKYLIHKKEFTLFREVLNNLVLNFHSLSSPITFDHKSTNPSIDLSLLDLNVLEEFAYISWKQNNFDNLRWLQKNIIDRVNIDSYLNPPKNSIISHNVEAVKLESFKTLSRWLKNCMKMSTVKDKSPSSSTEVIFKSLNHLANITNRKSPRK